VLSDGRFAALGGIYMYNRRSSCEALSFGADAHWTSFAPMHDARVHFACAAVWLNTSSSLVACCAYQPNCTTRCLVGGYGFRADFLTTAGSLTYVRTYVDDSLTYVRRLLARAPAMSVCHALCTLMEVLTEVAFFAGAVFCGDAECW